MNHERAPRQAAAADGDRAADIVAKMSLADKVALACADFAGIRQRAGNRVRVEHAQGSWGDVPLPPVPPALLSTPRIPGNPVGPGVLAEYVDGPGQTPGKRVTRIEPGIEGTDPPAGFGSQWRATWTTVLTPAHNGHHRFSLAVAGKTSLYLDGALVAEGAREAIRFIDGPSYALQAVVHLVAGQPVTIRVEYETGPALAVEEFGLRPEVRLGWQPPDSLIDDAAAMAAQCDAAVVIVNQASGEGMDRQSLALPGDQDRLITEAARHNPRTIVVLNTPGPVLMPWLENVEAVLQVWYPGERFGAALASVLFGDEDPGGRLPVTFPAHAAQGPVQAIEQYPGVAEEWLRRAETLHGSWWPDYAAWLTERCGEEHAAPAELGGGGLPPVGAAPGTYVYDH